LIEAEIDREINAVMEKVQSQIGKTLYENAWVLHCTEEVKKIDNNFVDLTKILQLILS
jgi:hypothetical protein